MRIFSKSLEKRAIRTLTAGKRSVSSTLFATLKLEHFHLPACREAFQRISTLAQTTGHLVLWDELLEDPALSQPARNYLAKYKEPPHTSLKRTKRLINALDKWRRTRALLEMVEVAANGLKQDKINLEDLVDEVSEKLVQARVGSSHGDAFYNYGKRGDRRALKLLESILDGKVLKFIPTGFRAFDDVSRGIARGAAVVLAASTSGGKSCLALNMAKNMAHWGARVGFASLEMEPEENQLRLGGMLSGIPIKQIHDTEKLSSKQREHVLAEAEAFHKRVQKIGGLLSFVHPEEDVSLEELMFMIKPYKYDVFFLDYINLLRGMDGPDQWQKLSSGARFCKRFASATKSIVVLLAQLSDEGIIRYSRGMREHACLTADALVPTENGLMPIGSLVGSAPGSTVVGESIKVETPAGLQPLTALHNNGIRQVMRTTFNTGQQLTTTYDQGFYVKREKLDWVDAKDLQIGDRVCLGNLATWPAQGRNHLDTAQIFGDGPNSFLSILCQATQATARSMLYAVVNLGYRVRWERGVLVTSALPDRFAQVLQLQARRLGWNCRIESCGDNQSCLILPHNYLEEYDKERPASILSEYALVTSIEPCGEQEVYDITVPGPHCFYANGLVVRNSVMWSWVYDSDAKESHLLKITQQKARNHEPTPFILQEDFSRMRVEDFQGVALEEAQTSPQKNNGKSHRGKLNGKNGRGHRVVDDEADSYIEQI